MVDLGCVLLVRQQVVVLLYMVHLKQTQHIRATIFMQAILMEMLKY